MLPKQMPEDVIQCPLPCLAYLTHAPLLRPKCGTLTPPCAPQPFPHSTSQANKAEQNRLRQGGAQLAPLGFHLQGPAKPQEMGVGPLRLWPGGLCVSRSIGDLDSGPLVVPLPHVRQIILPRQGGLRLIMASDGLWDLVTFSKAAKSTRHKVPTQAVTTLIQVGGVGRWAGWGGGWKSR